MQAWSPISNKIAAQKTEKINKWISYSMNEEMCYESWVSCCRNIDFKNPLEGPIKWSGRGRGGAEAPYVCSHSRYVENFLERNFHSIFVEVDRIMCKYDKRNETLKLTRWSDQRGEGGRIYEEKWKSIVILKGNRICGRRSGQECLEIGF